MLIEIPVATSENLANTRNFLTILVPPYGTRPVVRHSSCGTYCTPHQARLESQGLPSFRKMAKGLGGKEVVFLWIRKTFDSSEFITEIQVTHADPANPGCECYSVHHFADSRSTYETSCRL